MSIYSLKSFKKFFLLEMFKSDLKNRLEEDLKIFSLIKDLTIFKIMMKSLDLKMKDFPLKHSKNLLFQLFMALNLHIKHPQSDNLKPIELDL